MKKIIILIMVFSTFATDCFALESQYQLLLNGKKFTTTEPIFEQNEEVFLSVKDTTRLINDNYEIRQNKTDRSVIIITNGQYSYFKEGRMYGILCNKTVRLKESPFMENGELYLPASVCAKITGYFFIKSKSYLQFFKW